MVKKGAKRNRQTSEEQKLLREYHDHSDRHVLVLEADLSEDQKRRVFAMANRLRLASNELVAILNKRYEQMIRTKQYRGLMNNYGVEKDRLKKTGEEESDLLKYLSAEMNKVQKQFGLTKTDCTDLMETIYPKYGLNAQFAQARALKVWEGMKKILYKDGKHLHFKKRGDLPEIRATQSNRAIPIKIKDGDLAFSMEKLDKGRKTSTFTYKNKDAFQSEEIKAVIHYLENKDEVDHYAVKRWKENQEKTDTFRPCYASLNCKVIRGRLRVFIHITIEGNPLPKKNTDGSLRHIPGTGIAGCDLGPQSVAWASDYDDNICNLGQRNKSKDVVDAHDKKIRKYQRSMDRSRRKLNPENYNDDGTVKKGKKVWKKSNRYKRKEYLVREMRRKDALSRKYAHQELANDLRVQADVVVIEERNAKKLQKRSKKLERQDKVTLIEQKDGSVKEIRKFKRKKRHGKSILNRAPGEFQSILEKKFRKVYIVDRKYRASQYEHPTDSYIKKGLSQRVYTLTETETKVQRDWYSAYLLYCFDPLTRDINSYKAEQCFDEHWARHEYNILEGLKCLPYEVKNSGIRPGM